MRRVERRHAEAHPLGERGVNTKPYAVAALTAGLAASIATGFATPLGVVPLDRAAMARVLGLPQVNCDDDAHAVDHALEVQLPFLQVVLDEFTIVPFLVGRASGEEVAEVEVAMDERGRPV